MLLPIVLVGTGAALSSRFGKRRAEAAAAEAKRTAAADKRDHAQRMALMEARAALLREGINPDDVDPGEAVNAVADAAGENLLRQGNGAAMPALTSAMEQFSAALAAADAAGVDTAIRTILGFAGIPTPPELDGLQTAQTVTAASAAGVQVETEPEEKGLSTGTVVAIVGGGLALLALGVAVSR